MTHLYVGIENLALTGVQKATLVEHLKKLGPPSHPQPSHLCHWRIRLDGDAAIFEAQFDAETVTPAAIAARLEAIFGVAAGSVTWTTSQGTYGPVVTFKYGATNRLRLVAFGGTDATWDESHDAVLSYLSDYRAQWETEV